MFNTFLVGSEQQLNYKKENIKKYRKEQRQIRRKPNFQTIALIIRGTSPLCFRSFMRQETFFCSGTPADTNN
jgi:hypothetical protein